MNASEFTATINALFERLYLDDANIFIHEGGMPFGVRGEKKRVKGCYLSKDAEGELCIVIEADKVANVELPPICRTCAKCGNPCVRGIIGLEVGDCCEGYTRKGDKA